MHGNETFLGITLPAGKEGRIKYKLKADKIIYSRVLCNNYTLRVVQQCPMFFWPPLYVKSILSLSQYSNTFNSEFPLFARPKYSMNTKEILLWPGKGFFFCTTHGQLLSISLLPKIIQREKKPISGKKIYYLQYLYALCLCIWRDTFFSYSASSKNVWNSKKNDFHDQYEKSLIKSKSRH